MTVVKVFALCALALGRTNGGRVSDPICKDVKHVKPHKVEIIENWTLFSHPAIPFHPTNNGNKAKWSNDLLLLHGNVFEGKI